MSNFPKTKEVLEKRIQELEADLLALDDAIELQESNDAYSGPARTKRRVLQYELEECKRNLKTFGGE